MDLTHDVVFLLDVDNTLLDNDRVIEDFRTHLEKTCGKASASRYWVLFEQLREELGYADYLGALQRYRTREIGNSVNGPGLLQLSTFLIDYPFAERLYPGAFRAIEHVARFGPTVILTDGDVVFQPHKILRSGLWAGVGGRVLIYIHKELMLDEVQRHYPARHYVMVDDKLRILAAMKQRLGDRLTTVFPRQGHYAFDEANMAAFPPADITLERICDLAHVSLTSLIGGLPHAKAHAGTGD